MNNYTITIDEKISVWQKITMIVEAEDESTLYKEIERQALNIIEIVDVETLHDTESFIEYDSESLEIKKIDNLETTK
jgi:hypothetical protein